MSTVSHDDIAHLAHLARLQVSEEEKTRYADQLSGVVAYVEQLQKIPTEDAAEGGVTGLYNVLAADEPRQAGDAAALNPEIALAAAPLHDGHFIQVRAVLGGEEEAA